MRVLRTTLVLLNILMFSYLTAHFTNVTADALPETIRGAFSVAWVDINNNGLQDIFIAPYYFYLNNGDGTFTAKSYDEFANLGISSNTRVAFADANNNGYIDMVISDHAHTTTETSRFCYFFENSGPPHFTFTGQTIYQLPLNIKGGQPIFLDINSDGKMEIFLATFGNWSPNYAVGMDQLFRQNDQGGWDNITAAHIPELTNPVTHRPSRGVNVCDFDMDFDLDIFVPVYTVGSFNAANFLWVNDGNGHFVDRAAQAGVDLEPHCRYQLGLASGAAFGDLNNNGWFDLCVANIHGWAAVYENNKDGSFSNITENTGLDLGMGGTPQEKQWHNANWIDHNNNGYLDLWLTQWYGNEGFVCFVYENQGPENPGFFVDVTEQIGFNKRQEFNEIQGLAAGDYTGNGFLDILLHTRAGYDTQYRGNYLFRNEGNDNNWMQLKLIGDGNNVSQNAIGCQARIFYQDGTASYIRQVEAASSDQSMHQHVLHFGLGKQEEIQQVMVRWLDGRTEYWQADDLEGINSLINLQYGSGSTTSSVLFVDASWQGTPDGTAYKPYSSIQQAINRSQNGFIVSVAPGYYLENIDFSGKNIKVVASGSASETVVMGSTFGSPKILFSRGENNDAVLQGFTVTGELGSGIHCLNSSPTIIDCIISLNAGDNGGGLYFLNSQAKLSGCTVSSNEASQGGAMFLQNSVISVASSYIQGNNAGSGGAIKGVDSSLRLVNCLLTSNISANDGIINLHNGGLNLDFCTITANDKGLTLTGNPDQGGWKIRNSIIYGNSNFDIQHTTPLDISYSNTTTPRQGTGNISLNPMFVTDINHPWRLSPFSPCIGAGIATSTATDLAGNPRPQPADAAPDMGCYENERALPAPAELYVSVTGSDAEGNGSLANPYATINYAIASSIGGEKVIVTPGRYYENIVFNGRNSMVVSLYAVTGAKHYIYETIIDGGSNNTPVVRFQNGESSEAGLKGLTITNGTAANGAGILVSNAHPTLSTLRVIGNTASTNGGGIMIQNANPVLQDIIISDNQAGNFGGGLFIITARPLLDRIDINNNRANSNGGLAVNNSQLFGRHFTVADNQATGANPQSGGILSVNSEIYLINSIIRGNTPTQTAAMLNGTIDIFYSSYQGGFEGEGNIDADPLFLSPNDRDYRLSPDSPCIDAGAALFVYEDMELINLPPASYSGAAPDMGAHDLLFADAGEELELVPAGLRISAAPNPFNPNTLITLSLLQTDTVSLTVYNIRGHRVKQLMSGKLLDSGMHYIYWEGDDDYGTPCASGIYLIRLTSGSQTTAIKVMMLK